MAGARTSKQAHLQLQRHTMRGLGPVGPHCLEGGGEGEGGRDVGSVMKVLK